MRNRRVVLRIQVSALLVAAAPLAVILGASAALAVAQGHVLAGASPSEPAGDVHARGSTGIAAEGSALGTTADLAAVLTAGRAVDPAVAQAREGSIDARHLYLPMGSIAGDAGDCAAVIAVQNIGDEPSKAIVLTWSANIERAGGPGGGEVDDVSPDGLLCSGLIRPGATWEWQIGRGQGGAQSGAAFASAVAFSFSARTLTEVRSASGADGEPVADDVVADLVCDKLAQAVVGGSPDGYARFRQAYIEGAAFDDVDLSLAIGAPLAAQVWRECPGDTTPGVTATALYDVPAAFSLGLPDPNFALYEYHGSPFYRARSGMTSTLSIQNAGGETATVELWTRPANACGGSALCMTFAVPPGTAAAVGAEECIQESGHYAVWLSSTQPLAAVMSVAGNDSLAAHTLAPVGELVDRDGSAVPPETRYSLSGPLVYDPSRGWTTAVEVENLSSTLWADIEVVFVDHAGSEILAQLGYICPRGARTFTLPASSLQPGMRVGGVRVASLPPQGDPDGARSPIAAVALTALKSELGGDAILEYGSYRLLNGPAPLTGTTTSSGVGAGVVAVPHVGKDLDRSGFAGELAVTDLAGDRGWTDVAVLLVDQNALVDTLCRRVGAGATEYIDLEAIGVLDPGFRGSALVSASYWEHLPAGAPPTPERGRVAIGAASVWRARSVVGRDVPGDEMAIALGTSFEQLPADLAVTLGQPCDRHAPSPPAPPIVSHPDGALTGQVAVPALNRDDVTVTNTGSEAGVALVMAWDEEQSRCAPDCAAPLAVTCTGLLAPGGSWTVTADELPPQADSAIVLSLTAATMAEIGATPASTDKVADVLCAATDGAPCDADRRLRLAYARGLDLMVPTIDGSSANVPMAGAYGPPIAVALGADAEPPGHGKGAYDGVPGSVVLANDPRDGAHTYAVAGVYVLFESDWTDSWLTVQNAGVECANVELRFRAYGDCRRDRICRIDSIGPGSAATFVPQDCVGAGWFGSVVVRGTEPLAVLRHTFTGDRWVTAPAFAAASAYDLDGDWRLSPADVTAMGAALGSRPGDAAWNPRADIDGNQVVNDTDRLLLESNICGADKAQRPEPPDGPNVPATQAALPVLNSAGLDSIPCHTTIEVQNVGDEDTGVVLVAFDAAGDPLEPCAGPTAVECSGIIRPGGAWYMAADGPIDGEGVLGGSRSAMLFSLSAEPVDVFPFEVDDLWFSLVCETLFFGVTGDCDDYAKFKAAFDSGGTFAGIPMDRAIGDPITARVRRECLDSGFSLPSSPTASYAAIGANQFGADDSARGGYVYYAPSVQLWPDSCVSAIHMQNAGAQPATVELWVQSEDPCGSGQLCNVWTIEPGETVATESCGRGEAGGRWSGAARIKSNRPLGVVVETVLNGVVYDYAAMPARVSSDAAGAPLLDGSGQVLFGQLAFDRGQAWDVAVRVQNTSESRPARVRVEFQDAYGAVVLSADDTVCAGGSGTFLSPADGSGSGLPPGAVRVESLPLPDVKGVEPVELVAVLEAVQWSDVTRAMLLGAFSTRLQPEPAALVWPAGSGEGGLESGIGVVAVPALLVADGPERTDALAVTNRVLSPGWTDIAVVLRDQNAVVDVLCRRIYGGQVDYIELGAMPALAAGFHGSAVVSARAWQHPVLDRETGLARNIVGLGAAAVRKSDRFGALAEAVPAYIGAVEGTPLRSMPWPADEPLGNLCYTPPALAHEIYVPNALIGH